MKNTHTFWTKLWYEKSSWVYFMLPLSALFWIISVVRKFLLVTFYQKKLPVPVIVIGNISVGGTGKTPLIITLVKYLQEKGYSPGVVSRGYGGHAPQYPYLLDEASKAVHAGDEPLLIFQATQCLVCVAPDRVAAAKVLATKGCDIILSDDGLQHYQLGRTMEIAVIDGERLFGNQFLLPAGPLRETVSRLKSVDLIVVNNASTKNMIVCKETFAMSVKPVAWRQVKSGVQMPLDTLPSAESIHAVAGIGNPQRFFRTLDSLSIFYTPHVFPDHHVFTKADLTFDGYYSILMTEKDAVKCESIDIPDSYALIVSAELSKRFWQVFNEKLFGLMS